MIDSIRKWAKTPREMDEIVIVKIGEVETESHKGDTGYTLMDFFNQGYNAAKKDLLTELERLENEQRTVNEHTE